MRKFGLFIAALLASCGPIYSTQYNYIEPATRAGQACTDECKERKDYCVDLGAQDKEYCEAKNEEEIEECNQEVMRKHNRPPKWTECGRQRYCPDVEDQCESTYRDCYRLCGGKVVEEQVCVLNCESN